MYRLFPIFDQLTTSNIITERQVVTVFSVFTGGVRKVASQLGCPSIRSEEFISKAKTKILFDHKNEQRKSTDWNYITFACCHQAHHTAGKATTDCIENLFAHHEDVLDYMRNNQLLLHCLLDTFRNHRRKPPCIPVNSCRLHLPTMTAQASENPAPIRPYSS